MRKGCYLLVAFLAAGICQSIAQEIPTHDKYVVLTDETKPGRQKGPNGWEDNPAVQVPLTLENYLPTWQPGTPLSEDENFYISRVPLKKRFVNTNTQVNPALTQDRKFCLWTPMGISDTYWQSLPRYVLAGDNFSMWSYIDSHGGWSLPYIRIPGAYSDVAHKNGVANSGGLIFFDSWGGDNKHAQDVVRMLTTKGGTGGYTYKYSQKLVQFMYYYGIDGIGVNPEGTVPNAADFQDFISECRTYAQSLGREFHVYWYGTSSNTGSMNLGSDFVSSKQNWLYKNNKQVVDMYMLNYSWAGSAASSTSLAERIGANPYTLYAGYDIQGNWLGRGDWNTLKNNKLSIAFWGNHTTNMIYQNSTDGGSGDEAMAYCYLDKQEQVFSGGNQNPAKLPPIANGVTESSGAAMKRFHGIATLLPARSTLQELPFVTRFGLGNGKFFNYEGVTTFDKKWFNVGVQDYLPTWRWWITDNNGNVPADAINCGFTYEDAWFAGSAMHVTGKTAVSNVRLFKTNFTVNATDKVSLVYKLNSGTESRMKLFWSFVGSENTLHTCDITGGEQGKWVKFSKLATAIGMKGQVALLGIKFENTPADYDVYIGELSIVPSKSFAPVKPTITTNESKILKKRTYNSLEFKFSWNCTPKTAPAQPFIPVYNEDVDTWYFEVYVQANDGEPMLCGTTSSWAHYVVGAPVSTDNNATYRIGVCAVAPDGVTKSDIAWTNYLTIPVTKLDGIKCNKSVIKANEEFTLSLLDPNQDAPIRWTITNASTGANAENAGRVKEVTMSLPDEGYYDVALMTTQGNLFYRGFIQISPKETGSVPEITDFTASKTQVDLSKTGDNSVSLTYTGKKNEGTVSRGLHILDPGMFRIPKEILPLSTKSYSIGLWLKPESLSPAKYGINLLNQRDITTSWPNNNWGRFWVHIWPEFKTGAGTISENCVSYVVFNHGGTEIPEGNRHENPNIACSTDATGRAQHGNSPYKLMIGQWSHIFITYDYSSKTQKIYFNGKEVGSYSQNTKDYYYECPIYVGGSNVYHSGFTGVIDDMQVWNKTLTATEVADAIKGYANRTVPSNLVGYWTFENSTYNTTTKEFTNLGTGNKTAKAAYIEFGGASGEDTSSATESIVAANIGVEGNPALPGTLPIVTTSTFTIANAEVLNSGDQATATFRNNGEYDVTLKLANGWGSDTMTKKEYIVVVGGSTSDLDGNVVENMTVYPNPFVGSVNLLFSETGNYEISVYDVQGRRVVNKLHQSIAGEIYVLDVNANPGTYYIAISENGKRIKTFKVISK